MPDVDATLSRTTETISMFGGRSNANGIWHKFFEVTSKICLNFLAYEKKEKTFKITYFLSAVWKVTDSTLIVIWTSINATLILENQNLWIGKKSVWK